MINMSAGAGKNTTGIGLRHVRVGVRSDYGLMTIPDGTDAGTAYAGVQAQKARALTITPADPVRVTARGDDVSYHTFQESPTDTPTGELRTQTSDIDLISLITSVKDFGSPNMRAVMISSDKVGQEEPMIVWGMRKAIDSDKTLATYGQRHWEMYVVLNAYLAAKPPTMEDQQIGEFTWGMVANNSSVDHLGRTMTEDTHGCTEAPFVIVHTRYKPWLDYFEGDGSEDEFQCSKSTGDIKYNTATSPVIVTVNGALQTSGWSIDAAGLITFSSPPADGARIACFYEWED